MTEASEEKWSIGRTIRNIRKSKDWSLSRLAETAQVSKSNLSKIENDAISPTFDMIERIAKGLGISSAALLSHEAPRQNTLSFTNNGEGVRSLKDKYEFEFLFADLTDRKMMPMITTVHPNTTEAFSPPSSHGGEEFFIVLEGCVEFQSGDNIHRTMSVGDAVYFNSSVQHLVVNKTETDARLLWVWLA